MQKSHNELGAVELLLLAGLALLWALWTVTRQLLVPALALLLTLARWRPAAPAPTPEPIEASQPAAAPVTAAAAPILAELASEAAAALHPLTVTELRRRARAAGLPRALSRTGRRDALLSALSGLEVALI